MYIIRRVKVGEERIAAILHRQGGGAMSYDAIRLELSKEAGFGVNLRSIKRFIAVGVQRKILARVWDKSRPQDRGQVKLTPLGKKLIQIQEATDAARPA